MKVTLLALPIHPSLSSLGMMVGLVPRQNECAEKAFTVRKVYLKKALACWLMYLLLGEGGGGYRCQNYPGVLRSLPLLLHTNTLCEIRKLLTLSKPVNSVQLL